MIKYFVNGGIFMWFILIDSICGLAVIIEKTYLFLKNEKQMTIEEKNNFHKILRIGTREEILEFCNDRVDSVSKMIVKIVENVEIDFEHLDSTHKQSIEEIINESILEKTTYLEKGMSILGTVVNSAPQLGLLGTVTGMITAFAALTANGTGNAKVVANGISEALYTTAFGLIVAIPALVFYNFYNRRIDLTISEMERAALHFLSRIKN